MPKKTSLWSPEVFNSYMKEENALEYTYLEIVEAYIELVQRQILE